jgi:hypothetical protein
MPTPNTAARGSLSEAWAVGDYRRTRQLLGSSDAPEVARYRGATTVDPAALVAALVMLVTVAGLAAGFIGQA